MDVGEYLISVSAAAIISSCVTNYFDNSNSVSRLIKVLCGIFVSLAVIRPIADLDLSDFRVPLSTFTDSAQHIVSTAQEDAASQQQAVIKEKAEAYVYDKASALGSQVTVSVELSKESPYQPKSIHITGALSPYAKAKLSTMITADLGIQPEAQRWSS